MTLQKVPQTYEEYLEELGQKLSFLEMQQDRITGLDERLDITNKLLIEVVRVLASSLELYKTWLPKRTKNPSYIKAKRKLVDTAGIAVQLPDVKIPEDFTVVIKALAANTGTIYVGNSKPEAEDTTMSFPLSAGESIEYEIQNLEQLWIDATVANEGITWTVEQE